MLLDCHIFGEEAEAIAPPANDALINDAPAARGLFGCLLRPAPRIITRVHACANDGPVYADDCYSSESASRTAAR